MKNLIKKPLSKITALLLGLLLWYYNHEIQVVSEEILLPIKYINQPPDFFLNKSFKNESTLLKINGYVDDIYQILLGKNHIQLFVDLENASPKQKKYKIQINVNKVMKKLLSKTIYNLRDEYIMLSFKRRIKKKVKINLNIENIDFFKKSILNMKYTPNEIYIYGPEEDIKNITYIHTKKLALREGMDYITIGIKELNSPNILYSKDNITINILWDELIGYTKLKNLPIKIMNLKGFKKLNPSFPMKNLKSLKMKHIIYSGNKDKLFQLKKNLFVSCEIALKQEKNKYFLKILIHEKNKNFEIIDYNPKELVFPIGK